MQRRSSVSVMSTQLLGGKRLNLLLVRVAHVRIDKNHSRFDLRVILFGRVMC